MTPVTPQPYPMRPVFDLHCDLLYYLTAAPRRTPLDPTSRCSLQQLRDGGVALQVMAIFNGGFEDTVARGLAQAAAFQGMLEDYPEHFRPIERAVDLAPPAPGEPIGLLAAVENASALGRPDEPLRHVTARLETLNEEIGPLLYVSLTWRHANRFGGGDAAPGTGLTTDGYYLLEDLADLGIAIDLSHASDALAADILRFIDSEHLPLRPLASHSNLRAVTDHARNLPDELAQEIVKRGGVIGLNLVRSFVGPNIDHLAKHVERGLSLGLGPGLVLGTDFFWEGDLPSAQTETDPHRFFFSGFGDASCHPAVQGVLQEALQLDDTRMDALCFGNARRFVAERLGD